MATITFTPSLARHVEAPEAEVAGDTLRETLETYFRTHPNVRGYVLDDQGAVRKHVAIFINQELIQDRAALNDPVKDGDDIFVVQALSGG